MPAHYPTIAEPATFDKISKAVQGPSDMTYHDVLSLEDWALKTLWRAPVGMVFCWPMTPEVMAFHNKQAKLTPSPEGKAAQDAALFIPQVEALTCGGTAAFNLWANTYTSTEDIYCYLDQEGLFADMLAEMDGRTQIERYRWLEKAEITKKAQVGSPEEREEAQDTQAHFSAFVCIKDYLLELDGRCDGPIVWGPCKTEEFGKKCLEVMNQYVTASQNDTRFTTIAAIRSMG